MASKDEKQQQDDVLPQPISPAHPARAEGKRSKRPLIGRILLHASLLGLVYYAYTQLITSGELSPWGSKHHHHHHHHGPQDQGLCKQADPIIPQAFNVSELVEGQDGRIREWLSGAVRVPTEMYDGMGDVGEDNRWDVFYKFSEYLEKAFPLVHQHLTRTRVVTHALIFEWVGSDPSLKPLLITGHQDVVPVLNATKGLWTHDPFGGEYEESTGLIWGRGSTDDKTGVIGSLAAIELLLQSKKFAPTRTVILAFGNDEEAGGKVGALHLSEWIENKYGKDSISILVDEGAGISEMWGQLYAQPAVGEKGYLDVDIRVETLGGHSSVPPIHTGIGYIALLIAELEKHPHRPHLNADSPLVNFLSCAASTAPDMPRDLRKAVHKLEGSLTEEHKKDKKDKKGKKDKKVDKKALKDIEEWWVEGSYKDGTLPRGMGKAMISTTQAVDIINGGVKVNALPEVVSAVVNHRINIASSVSELQDRIISILSPVAGKYNLALEAWGKDIEIERCPMMAAGPRAGKVVVAVSFNSTLEPAPVSPHTIDDPAWRLLAGTVKGVYATRPGANSSELESVKTIEMAPTVMTGNTDTKRYWDLTRNIYRFAYLTLDGRLNNIHTVDEHVTASAFVEQVRWFISFIVNVDESREV